jgi:NitT/TauT family transport system substrate-binding protein
MTRFLASTAAALAATLGLLAASAPAAAQGKGESVKFQDYPGLGNMLIRVAIAKGYCERAGIKCELQTIPAAPLGAQAMLAKSIDSFLGPSDVMNQAVMRGAKKIGVTARGAATEVTMRWMLTKAGVNPDDVTFVAVGAPNTAYGALVSKQVDALSMFEPAGAMCDVLKTCKVLWRAAIDKMPAEQFALNGGGNGLVFTQEYIDRNPHVIDAVIRAVKDADAFINVPANFEAVTKITQQFFRFDMPRGDEVLTTALKIAIDSGTYRAAINRKAIQANLDLLLETKQIEKAAAVSDLVLDRAP